MYNATTFESFAIALRAAQYWNSRIAQSTSAPATYEDGRYDFYLAEDSLSGFAIGHSGELVGVFSRVKGRGETLMVHAIYRGAELLECFEGFLPKFYEKHGFIEIASLPNWAGAHLPRVVYMALGGQAHVDLSSMYTVNSVYNA